MKKMKRIKKMMMLLGITLHLQSCIFVAGAAAGAAAIAMVYDHRTVEKTIEDQKIAHSAHERINANSKLRDSSHIEVTALNGIVLLTGETPNEAWREQAETITQSVPHIKRIYNQITIQRPTSSLTRTSDSWITTKIKAKMLATVDLKSSDLKIITENGTVFLMGTVSHSQANIAAEIARQISGVQRVIKIFQYRKIENKYL